MPDAFISYSRRDSEIADALVQFLERDCELDVWIDRQDIPGGTRWRDELRWAIDASDAFVLVASPASLISANVRAEVVHAIASAKVPVVLATPAAPDALGEPLDDFQILRMMAGADQAPIFDGVASAIRRDHAWRRRHSELLQRSEDWHAGTGALLHSMDYQRALQWMAAAAGVKDRTVTDRQRAYIDASARQAEAERAARADQVAERILAGLETPTRALDLALTAVADLSPTALAVRALNTALTECRLRSVTALPNRLVSLVRGPDDGTVFVSDRRHVYLVDSRRQEVRLVLPLAAECLAWADAIRTLAIGSAAGITLWREPSGLDGPHPLPSGALPRALAWAPDGSRLVAGTDAHGVEILDGRTLRREASLDPQGQWPELRDVDVTGSGAMVAVADSGAGGIVWEPRTGALQVIEGAMLCTAIAPDGERIFFGGQTEAVMVHVGRDARPQAIAISTAPRSAAWSRTGERLAIGGTNGSIAVRSRSRPTIELVGHEPAGARADASGVAWEWGEDRLISAGVDATVRAWDPRPAGVRPLAVGGERTHLGAWAPDASACALVLRNPAAVAIVDVESGAVRQQVTLPADAEWIGWSGVLPGPLILGRKHLVVLDCRTGALSISPGPDVVAAAAFSPDGRALALGGRWREQERLEVRSLASGHKEIEAPLAFSGDRAGIAWSPDGERLAVARGEESVDIVERRNGRTRTAFQVRALSYWSVAWAPDARLLLGSRGRRRADAPRCAVHVADADEETLLNGAATGEAIPLLAWHPRGRRALVGDAGACAVWDMDRMQPIQQCEGSGVPAGWNAAGTRVLVCGDAPFTWEPHPFEIEDLVALARARQAATRPVSARMPALSESELSSDRTTDL
jgi:WD40 repeat protein